MSSEQVSLYLTGGRPCPYLRDRDEVIVLTNPSEPIGSSLYSGLLLRGFRRNGIFAYRPACPGCEACVSVRIPVDEFQPRRGQRRVWARNADLRAVVLRPYFDPAHWALYRRYQRSRHTGGGMDSDDPQGYAEMILDSPVDSCIIAFMAGNRTLAVALVDVLPTGVSAVYTFYDPEEMSRGLGTYAILWQVAWTETLGLPHLYLGYWVKDSPKMDYKRHFNPLEGFVDGHWRTLEGVGR